MKLKCIMLNEVRRSEHVLVGQQADAGSNCAKDVHHGWDGINAQECEQKLLQQQNAPTGLKPARPYHRRISYPETGLLLRTVALTYRSREHIVITTVFFSIVVT